MSVAAWNSIGQNQRVKIMTVDPVSRKVEAATKDGAMIQIAVWGQPTVFRWPRVGEIWIVTRMGGYWVLVEPVLKDAEEPAPLEILNAGDVNVTTGAGGRFLVNGAPVTGGASTGTPTYAIQVKRASGGPVSVAVGNDQAIPFTDVYFENNNGVMFPPDGGVWPPAPTDSMFTLSASTLLTAPVAGLWGYHAAYAYDAIPFGTFFYTRTDHINSTVAIRQHAREALTTGTTFAVCDIEGTVVMDPGDYIAIRAHQESATTRTISVDPFAIVNDEPGSGPIFAMWLIAPRTT